MTKRIFQAIVSVSVMALVLCLLLRSPGTVFSREQLISQVWGYAFTGETRTVDVHIRTLRQKLGPAGDYIETVRGVGYKIGAQL